jgi:Calcineurin-like phosphoesterase
MEPGKMEPPDASAATPVVVSYRSIRQILNNTEAVQEKTDEAAKAASDGSPIKQAMLLAQYGEALRALEDEADGADPDILISPQNRLASLLQSYAAESGQQAQALEPLAVGGAELKFFTDDYSGWIKSFFFWVGKSDWHKIVPPATDEPEPLGEKARIALVSDWGTGLYGAPDCARSIDEDPGDFQLLMHLGDIYYSGTHTEVRERFLDRWCKRPGVPSRALNGNHEMYSGGFGYFDDVLPALGQKSSYFAMQNEYWTLIALDTAHKDHDLEDEQVHWLKKVVAGAGNRKVVLFSHHQLFSRLEKQGKNLAEKLAELLTQKRIFAWYWGHEHRCVLYGQHPVHRLYGRCLGHGGMPYARKKAQTMDEDHHVGDSIWRRFDTEGLVPGGLLLDGPNEYMLEKKEKYGPNGYMALEIEGAKLTEVVYTSHRQEIYRRELT